VAKVFECKAAGVPCRFKATADSEDELLAKANEHAIEKHGVDLTTNQTLLRYAQSLVRDDSEEAAAR
jgi:predicted small metal-binding protein